MPQAGSTDLGPHLGAVLETDWPAFTAAWREDCAQRYRPAQ
ncbi:MAG: hypothetical protein AAGG38_01295 [Planctomycetota bacterium]